MILPHNTQSDNDIIGILLAGGLARRMGGGDKGLRQVGGTPILDKVIDRARPQVSALALNANGDAQRFSKYGLPVIADVIDGFAGPLAGVLTGLDWAQRTHPDASFVATFPTDAPFLPRDLVGRLYKAVAEEGADMACAASGGRHHPVVGLWPVSLLQDLHQAMTVEDIRKVDRWTARHTLAAVPFSTDPVDPFFNANRPEDLAEAEGLLRDHPTL